MNKWKTKITDKQNEINHENKCLVFKHLNCAQWIGSDFIDFRGL